MIRAGFAGEAVLRGMTTASLQEFLKSAFAIGIGDAVAIFESLEKDSSFQETANGIEAAIKVDRGDDRFEGVGEKGGLVAATGFFFTPAEAEMFAESEATSGDFEGVGVDDAGTAFGKLTFAPVGEIGEEIFAGEEFENGVAEKFETFIVLYGGAGEGNFFATGGAEFGNGGAVRQGTIQQSRLQELIAERNLELLVITANDHVHSRRVASPRAVSPGGRQKLLRSAHLGCRQFLSFIDAVLAIGLQAAGNCRALGEGGYCVVEVGSLFVANAEQEIIDGIGISVEFCGLLQVRNSFLELSTTKIDEAETAVGHGRNLIFGGGELLFGHIVWFGVGGQKLQGFLVILFSLVETFLFIGVGHAGAHGPGKSRADNGEGLRIIGIQLEFLVASCFHFFDLSGAEIAFD